MNKRDTWRLDLAKQAIRTAEGHLAAGRREHFHRSIAFAREMLSSWDEAVRMTQEQADGALAKELLASLGAGSVAAQNRIIGLRNR